MCQALTPVPNKERINIEKIMDCLDQLVQSQRFYEKTYGSHAAMLFDSQLNLLSLAEDVGRHNALDKAIGKVFMARQLTKACLAVLSSRMSYELVQKAARAYLPILVSMSNPTTLAVELAQHLNMTLACAGKESGLMIMCGDERIIR